MAIGFSFSPTSTFIQRFPQITSVISQKLPSSSRPTPSSSVATSSPSGAMPHSRRNTSPASPASLLSMRCVEIMTSGPGPIISAACSTNGASGCSQTKWSPSKWTERNCRCSASNTLISPSRPAGKESCPGRSPQSPPSPFFTRPRPTLSPPVWDAASPLRGTPMAARFAFPFSGRLLPPAPSPRNSPGASDVSIKCKPLHPTASAHFIR